MTKTTPQERAFASRVVRNLGALVGRLRQEAKADGLSEIEARRVLLLAFQIVGEKSELVYRSLVQKLRHNKRCSHNYADDDMKCIRCGEQL